MHELYKKERSFALGAIVLLYQPYLLISQPTCSLFLYSVIQSNIRLDIDLQVIQPGDRCK